MQANIYNQKGEQIGAIALPESVFNAPWNNNLVHQVFVSTESNKRNPIAHTKDRSDVQGGGKKPWRQKGTGQARHGSIRSPLWKGGGITFGPRNEKDYSKKINKKMKTKALFTILSRKLKDNEIIFVDDFSFEKPKTAKAKEVIKALSGIKGFDTLAVKRKNAALFALSYKNKNFEKSFGNFGNIFVDETRNLNSADVLKYKYLILSKPKESIDILSAKNKNKNNEQKTKKK